MTLGLLACGGGGSSGKTNAISSPAPASAVASIASSSSSVSSAPALDPGLVTSLTLGAPTTNPIVIPPSATAVPVKFLSVVRGNYYPEQLLLDELDKDGLVVRPGVALLKDDGTQGDAFRGDQIYTGQLPLGSVASVEKSYRVHVDHKGQDVKSGIGRFWVSGCPSVARPSNPDKAVLDTHSNSYVFADEVLVTLAGTVAPELSEINAIMADAKGQVVGCIPALNQYLVELADSTTAASLYAAIATLKSKTEVVVDASANAVVLNPPSDKDIACDGQGCQWYLERIRAPEAWALVGGGDKQMSVGVIDFGVDCTHTDLNCNGSANSEDKIDHGTGVASLIAAHKGDGSAMVGVAWNTALYPFSFIGRGGSQYKMSELITLSMAEESIRVINISAATAMDPSNQIRDAMCSAIDSGRLIVAAAGNASVANNCQLENVYPARYNSTGKCANGADLAKGLLVVGAIDANNNLAQWENNTLCSNTLHVDVFAPGKDIYAASANNNGYAAKNGTSFSSPLVAGSAAVLWASEPTLTVAGVHDKLVASSTTYAKGPGTSRNQTQDSRLEGKPLLDLFTAVGGRDTQTAPDLVPDAFALAERNSAALNSYITSERITIRGIDAIVPIAIEGGFYAIDNAPFTSAAGSVGPNQTLVVQLLSAAQPLTSRQATLTVGGVSQTFKVTTAAAVAAQPSSFDFTDIGNAELGSSIISSPLTLAGLTQGVPISIAGGEYSIDSGAFTALAGTVNANQNIRLRVTAASAPDTVVTATVTIAGVSDSFRVTSVAADINPEPFTFADINNVAPGSWVTSNGISVKGINTEANISISGGEYAIDGGTYSTASGKVKAGQAVTVRHRSANQFAAESYSALTIGSYTTTLRSHTSINTAPTASNISIQDINGGGMEVGDSLLGIYTYLDAENDAEGASSYRWLRNGVVIAGATSTTYVLAAADSGQDIRFEVTPVASGGVVLGGVKESPANSVANSAPRVTNLLISSGAVGDILRVSYSYQDAENDLEGASSYRWLRNGVAIAGATTASYQTVASDAGQALAVEITPVALSGKLSGIAVVSNAVLLGNSAPQAKSVAITGATAGKSAVGATLSGAYVFADVDGDLEGLSAYRWLRNGTAIGGATSRNYLLTPADSGQTIVFEVTPIAAKGTAQGEALQSSAVAVNSVPSAQAVKVVDNNGGSLLVGDSLTGAYTYLDAESDAQGTSRYRWLRNGSPISGAIANTYVLTSADSAQAIVFEVTPVAAAGSLSGVAVQSVAVSISNSAPVAANVAIVDSNGGSVLLNDTLNGTYGYSDSDGNSQGATTFRWFRNGTELVSTSQNYTVTAADSGQTLQFKVTPRATAGVVLGVEVASTPVTVSSFAPNSFSFTPVAGAAVNAVTTSNTVTISGINTPVAIAIVNGQYAINGGAFTSAPGTVSNGQTLTVRATASALLNTTVQAVVTVGGASSSFSVTTAVADSTPDPFSFPAVSNAAMGAVVTSTSLTISGINTAAAVSVTGGEYSINGSAFVAGAGTLANGQTLRLRVTAANALSTSVQAVVTVGGVAGTFTVTTAAADTTPDAFSFLAVNNVALNAVMTSNPVTISGINTATAISIVNGQYAINGGAFTSAAGSISNGQTVSVKTTAAANPATIMLATLTVGGVTGTFAVATLAADTTPDAFSFSPVTNAVLNAPVVSNAVTISGINTSVAISINNGQYAIGEGAFTSLAGTVSSGQVVKVRATAAASGSTQVQSVLTVGSSSAAFAVTTMAPETNPPAAAVVFPAQSSMTDLTWLVVRGTASDASGIGTITVNNTPAVYDQASLSWQATVPLTPGANTLTVTVADTQNNKSIRTLTVRKNPLGDYLSKIRVDANHNRLVAFDSVQTLSTQVQLITIDKVTGATNTVPGADIIRPKDLRLSADGTRALVLSSDDDIDVIREIDLLTGARKIIAQDSVAEPQGTYHYLYDLALDSVGKKLFVGDSQGLIELDLTTGVRHKVYNRNTGSSGIVWDAIRKRVVMVTSQEILAYSPATASTQVLFANTDSSSGLALDEENNLLYLSGVNTVVEVNLATGTRRLVSNNTIAVAASEASFDSNRSSYIALDKAHNRLLATVSGGVLGVDIASGARTWIIKNSLNGPEIKFNPATNKVYLLINNGLYSFVLGDTQLSKISDNSVAAADSSATFDSPRELVVDQAADKAYIGDWGTTSIFAVNLQTGRRDIFSDNSQTGSDNTLIAPSSLLWLENENRVLVLDNGRRSILSVNTATAARSVLSSTSLPNTVNALKDPADMLLSPVSGQILVLDRAVPAIFSVNPTTGARSIYGSIGDSSDPWLQGLEFNPGDASIFAYSSTQDLGRLLSNLTFEKVLRGIDQVVYDGDTNSVIALECEEYCSAPGDLVRLNLTTKTTSPLPLAPTWSGEAALDQPVDIALDVAANVAYVADEDSNAIFRVSLLTGKRTLFASNAIATASSNINFARPTAIAIDLSHNRLLVGDATQQALIAVDLTSASRTLISNNTVAVATSNISISPRQMTIDAAGRFAYFIGWGGSSGVGRVDMVTGERRLFSSNTIAVAASNVDFYDMSDLVWDEARGRLLVADRRSVIAIDVATGARSEVIGTNKPVAGFGSNVTPYFLAIDKQSNQLIVLDNFLNNVYWFDLTAGTGRKIATTNRLLIQTFGLRGIDYNASNNTLVLVEGYRDAVISADLKTGEAVVLSQ